VDTVVNAHVISFLTSLAIGLLIGVERERAGSAIGVRTFSLITLFGTVSALIGQSSGTPWFLPAALLAVVGIAVFNPRDVEDGKSGGTTTRVAIVICFSLGAMVWLGHGQYAVMLAVASAALLNFKTELRGLSERITSRDMVSILQFAALSFIVLPVLPNTGYGPYNTLNPHHIWLMVVLISGLSLAGYLAMRWAGDRFGPPLLGLLGGMVSSTATTLVYARHARQTPSLASLSVFVILMANLIVPLRLGLIVFAVTPNLISTLWPVLLGNVVAGGLAILFWWHTLQTGDPLPLPEVANPTELKTAITFGAMYAAILMLASWLSDLAGTRGLYLASTVSGLTELDAIVLSTLRLFDGGKLEAVQAANAIGLAIISNLCFKTGLLAWVAGRNFLMRSLPGMLAIALGLGAGIWIVN
jgi:uncharacterized membrane protein (DUF4010 family)